MKRFLIASRPVVALMGLAATGALVFQADTPPPAASHIMHAPIQVHRNADGSLKRGPHFEILTPNWAGYAVADFETGQTYTAAQATWSIPTVTFDASAASGTATQYSAMWVGIGGFCEDVLCSNVDPTLIQLGTAHDVASDGTTLYYSWYEAFPNPPVIMGNPVSPGDVITASVQCTVSCSSNKLQTWTLTMSSSAGWQWSVPVPYNSPKLSAEWIVEAPSIFPPGSVLPLADFATMTITDPDTGNESRPPLSLANNGILMADVMADLQGQLANLSEADALGFNVCWGAGPFPFFPPCSPP